MFCYNCGQQLFDDNYCSRCNMTVPPLNQELAVKSMQNLSATQSDTNLSTKPLIEETSQSLIEKGRCCEADSNFFGTRKLNLQLKIGGVLMKDYVYEFQNKLAEIEKDLHSIYIINAGAMNHGKSSLFNSLLDSTTFAAQDVRTTIVNETVKWAEDVYLIDTPGLEAEEADDKMAYNAYRRANVIVFVHTAKVGELHKKELEAINKIKSLFDSESFFWQHFYLVLTNKDADSEENISAILKKTLEDIETVCGGKGFKTFTVSNSRYKKGRDENKDALVNKSGIPELRETLQKNFGRWLGENQVFVRESRIKQEKSEILKQLEQEAERIKKSSEEKVNRLKEQQKNFLYKVEGIVNQYRSDEQNINSQNSQLQNLKSNLANTKSRWQREHY